jgi:hypothetical protein
VRSPWPCPVRRGGVTDPYAELRERVLRSVLDGLGATEPAIRNAAAENKGLPADLKPLVDKIHGHAYKVTDDDMAKAQEKYGDDKMFEIVVSAAVGASRMRLMAGLEALKKA